MEARIETPIAAAETPKSGGQIRTFIVKLFREKKLGAAGAVVAKLENQKFAEDLTIASRSIKNVKGNDCSSGPKGGPIQGESKLLFF